MSASSPQGYAAAHASRSASTGNGHLDPPPPPAGWTLHQLRYGPARDQPLDLARLGLRLRSDLIRDALVRAASIDRIDYRGLLADPDRGLALILPVPSAALEQRVCAAALAIAGLAPHRLGDEAPTPDLAWDVAAQMYLGLIERRGMAGLPVIERTIAMQTLFLAGRHAELRAALPRVRALPELVRHYLSLDVDHPYPSGDASTVDVTSTAHQQWEQGLSRAFTDHGFAPIRIRPRASTTAPPGAGSEPLLSRSANDLTLFDLVEGADLPHNTTHPEPLVSVVMPVHRPGTDLITSVRSILDQTWRTLEVLVVDDASGPEYQQWFDQVQAADSRVRVIRLPRNYGSFGARQAALNRALGSFVTFQDADDWSHPERLAFQVRRLEEHPQAAASVVEGIRATDELTHQVLGYGPQRLFTSSLMIRREALDRIGPLLPVRRGGDGEFRARIEALTGEVISDPVPLTMYRLRSGSLSRGDFGFQWVSPARMTFRGEYRAWHSTLTALRDRVDPESRVGSATDADLQAGISDFLAHHVPPTGYPSPPLWSDPAPSAEPWEMTVDEVHLADFSAPTDPGGPGSQASARPGAGSGPAPAPGLLALAEQLAAASAEQRAPRAAARIDRWSIGLWHLERPLPARSRRALMHQDWFGLVAGTARTRTVCRTDTIEIGRLIVHDPEVLLLLQDLDCALRPAEVEVRLQPDHLQPRRTGLAIDLFRVADTCRCWWGLWPRWHAAAEVDPAAAQQLRDQFPQLLR